MDKISDEIINKVLNGLASEDEARTVAKWFCTKEGQCYLNKKMYKDFSQIKDRFEEDEVNHPIPSEEMYHFIIKHIKMKAKRRLIIQIAAILIPFILLAGLFFQINNRVDLLGNSDYDEVFVPKGERIQLMFQDGSKAFLNSDSRICYPKQFGLSTRRIMLEGEAYFVIAHNQNRPFIVELGKASICVLGTSFNVQAYPEEKEINVTLDEGKINLVSWTKEENILNPKEKIIFNKESGKCNIIKMENTKSVSIWKNDVITFQNESLSEVIKVMSRWYNIKFVVKDKRVYYYSYTYTSENTLLEKVLQDLEKIAPVKFNYDNKTVIVSMK